MRSPWSTGELQKIVLSDFYPGAPLPISRKQAMKVPAIVKGRAIITGTLSRHPLAKYRGETKVKSDAWMTSSAGDLSPQARMRWTLDDLIFGGCSLWALDRDAHDRVTSAQRVPPEWWSIDEDLTISVLGEVVSSEEVCYFEGPQEGLCELAADTIEGALAIESAWTKRVKTPVPLMHLKPADAMSNLDPSEVDDVVDTWEKARRNGGVAYTPYGLTVDYPGEAADPTLFIEGRNAVRIDVANFLNLPAQLLDGTTATASLTYSTQEGTRNELVDLSLAYWATPIEERLSMDDMTPARSYIQFDIEYLSNAAQPAKGPNLED